MATIFAEVGDVAVRHTRDERAQADGRRAPRKEPESRVALEHVLPVPADRRDLQEVVHHPEAGETGLVRGRGDVRQPGGALGRPAGPAEAGDLKSELERALVPPVCSAAAAGAVTRSGATTSRSSGVGTSAKPSLGKAERTDGHCLQRTADHLCRDVPVADPVAGAAHIVGCVEDDGDARHACRLGQASVAGSPLGVEAE